MLFDCNEVEMEIHISLAEVRTGNHFRLLQQIVFNCFASLSPFTRRPPSTLASPAPQQIIDFLNRKTKFSSKSLVNNLAIVIQRRANQSVERCSNEALYYFTTHRTCEFYIEASIQDINQQSIINKVSFIFRMILS